MKDPISRMYYHNGNVIEDTVLLKILLLTRTGYRDRGTQVNNPPQPVTALSPDIES